MDDKARVFEGMNPEAIRGYHDTGDAYELIHAIDTRGGAFAAFSLAATGNGATCKLAARFMTKGGVYSPWHDLTDEEAVEEAIAAGSNALKLAIVKGFSEVGLFAKSSLASNSARLTWFAGKS